MKIKKMITAAAIALFATAISGCQEEEVQRYAWPLATASPEDTVTQIYAEQFAKEVERLSEGKMRIQVYPNSTLGGDRELLESCKDGDIPIIVQNTAPQVSFMPDTAVFDIPCQFDTMEEARKKVDSQPFYGYMEQVYEQAGYHLLGYADQGFRVMSTDKKVMSIEDFKGQKIRTMEDPFHMAFWKELKANPTPMTFSEVYIGLQQNTIDAQENPYEVIVSNRLYEQQDFVVETNHLPHFISLVMSGKFYESLDEVQQEIVKEAANNAKEYARIKSDERVADKVMEIEKSGTEIITLSDTVKADIRERSKPVYEEISQIVSSEIYEAYTSK